MTVPAIPTVTDSVEAPGTSAGNRRQTATVPVVTGGYTLGFILLGVFAAVCFLVALSRPLFKQPTPAAP